MLIPLTDRTGVIAHAIIDAADMPLVLSYSARWHLGTDGYAVGSRWNGSRVVQARLHRLIMQPPADLYVDHIDGNPLNNTRANLRLATNSQNQANTQRRRGRSPYRGVAWNSRQGKWQVSIMIDGKRRYIGLYADDRVAAMAYDEVAFDHFGEYARLNIPSTAEAC
jgi:hypothetical protein